MVETPLKDEVREAIENYDLSFERGILAAAFARPNRQWHDLYEYISGFGFSMHKLAGELGVGENLMWRLIKPGIRGSSVPDLFVERLAGLLGTNPITVRAMLGDAGEHSFADAIRFAYDMTPDQQHAWLEDVE